MFLGVSGTVNGMANESPTTRAERIALAVVLRRIVNKEFNGKAKAAYTHAKLNSGTWANLVKAEPAKDYSVVAAVNAFWPEAEGDWRRIPGLVIEDDPDIDLSTASEAELIAEIERLRAEIVRRQAQLEAKARREGITMLEGDDVTQLARPDSEQQPS